MSLADLQKRSVDLIRKGLDGSIFVAPYSEDTEIKELMGEGGLVALPDGYQDVGWITKDQGASWSREIDSSDVESLGSAEPTRRDITSDVTGLEFTMQEMKALSMELYEGVNLADLAAQAGSDTHVNVSFDKPDRPATLYYRLLALFKDGEGADAFYFARWLPRVLITDRGDQSWNENDEIQFPVTITAFNDPQFGTSVRNLFGIPTGMLEKMGIAPVEGG